MAETILDYFPLIEPRSTQVKVLQAVETAVQQGFRDIVIEAPTGVGKASIGTAICFWAKNQPGFSGNDGGYVLTAQKALQDQYEQEIGRYRSGFSSAISLKSAVEYPCTSFKNCGTGTRLPKNRQCVSAGCPYRSQKNMFMVSQVGVTNYPYFFAERTYVRQLTKRKVLVNDECHAVDRQIISFIDVPISEALLEKWAPTITSLPKIDSLAEYVQWIKTTYIPEVQSQLETLMELAEDLEEAAIEVFRLDQHFCKVVRAVNLISEDPSNWVFWTELDQDKKPLYIARTIDAAPFVPDLVTAAADLRVYMSAYPGSKKVFCRGLGLDEAKTAWLSFPSPFELKNRPIVMALVGSMSRRNLEATLPAFLRLTEKIARRHAHERGLIHVASYRLGQLIFDHLRKCPDLADRLLFPTKADERSAAFIQHATGKLPTILISPSITEGFDFAGDLARWQIIAKIAWPSLGDLQVEARQRRDPVWYAAQAVMMTIQACGRIVRSDTDHGISYILDADIEILLKRHPDLFPAWFTSAMVWGRRG